MPDAFSEDEYDALPDPFVNIDWEAVERSNNNAQTGHPPPRTPPITRQQGHVEQDSESSDEYDLLPDPFAGIVWDGDTPTNGVLAANESRPTSSNTTHALYRGQKRSLPNKGPMASSSKKSKREPFTPPQVNGAPTSAGRGHSIDQDSDILSVLKSFEDDITCPICCDMLACAHLGNPCGHCYCGECGWNWISTKARKPTCPICRTSLSATTPMIPNFALDNMVEKHLTLLAERGVKEWATNSDNYRNWEQRKRKWKTTASDRVKKSKKQPPPPPPMTVTAAEPFAAVLPFIYDEDPFDEDYVDDSGESDGDVIPIELLVHPDAANNATRRRRRRRRRTNT